MKLLFKDKRGQGTTEYIVILAVAVGIVMTIFWTQIKSVLQQKVQTITTNIGNAGN